MNKIISHLKKPATYVIMAVGGLIALSVPAVRNFLAPIAAKLPFAK